MPDPHVWLARWQQQADDELLDYAPRAYGRAERDDGEVRELPPWVAASLRQMTRERWPGTEEEAL